MLSGSAATVLAATSAFVVAALMSRRFLDPGSLFHLLDHPNERSLHQRPVPRSGGAAIMIALLVATPLVAVDLPRPAGWGWAVAATLALFVAGLVDDARGLGAPVRLLVQLAAAAAVVAGGFTLQTLVLPGSAVGLGALGPPVAVLLLVWMTNLYNFMDGMDGLAGGMALWGFSVLALCGWLHGDPLYAGVGLVIAAAAGGFLLFNLPPARLFMGDGGSSVLGLLAGILLLWGDGSGVLPLVAGLILFSPFVFDASFTLARRLLRGERIWLAHREHLYQRFVRCGWGHRRTLVWAYGLMALCAAAALAYPRLAPGGQLVMLGALAGLYALLARGVARLERAAADTGA